MNKTFKSIINERIQSYGISTLTDQEALCALTGIPIEVISKALETYNLSELTKYINSIQLTKTQKNKLELLFHLVKRIGQSSFKEKVTINSSTKAGEYFLNELQYLDKEVFMIALMDAQKRLIRCETISRGSISEAFVYPREIVKATLDNNAVCVILAHVHPGGSLNPSRADIEMTHRIVSALNLINVQVVDHIIVADQKYISFAERGLLNI
jgi:DNA repair protein RadC